MADMLKRIHRLATVDMRVDYISPGRGSTFVGTAEVLRVGKKGCTVRMNMHSNLGKLVATGMATYAY
jgi:acyl-coenzyme A thioesterase PaaI-like protein